jgi:oligoendopeptidase F
MTMTKAMPERSEIPVEETWDLGAMYASPEEWQAALEEALAMLPKMAEFQGRLAEGPETILAFFGLAEEIGKKAGKVSVYGFLGSAADSQDQEALSRRGQALGMIGQAQAAMSFADSELIAIGFDRLHGWLEEHDDLQQFAHYFERLEDRAEHTRSGDVEEVLALAFDPLAGPRTIYSQLTNADLKFDDAVDSNGDAHEVGQGTIDALLSDTDREVRKTAWHSYQEGYLGFKSSIASVLGASIKGDVFRMRARRYDSCLAASLAPNKIPTSVFHNLIEVYKKNLPTWHRYWDLRKKLLGYEELHWYDTVAPLSKNPPAVSFEQSVDWIAEGLRPLGGEYVEVLRSGCLEERWVDRAINKGKVAGAFSSGSYETFPYILMSYDDTLFSLSTLAHELGHSMHSYYSRTSQPFVYADYSLFVAEVASNFNQAMTRAYLFETQPDRNFHLALIEEAMSNFRRYFFIMPTLARFELELHERAEKGAPISPDAMNNLCADLFQEGFGDALVLDRERMGITWAQFGHLYSNFYVYQYATGIAGAHALAYQVLTDESGEAAARYLNFLKTGGSMYPIDALREAGVDLEQPEPVEKAFETLAEIVDRLETYVEE